MKKLVYLINHVNKTTPPTTSDVSLAMEVDVPLMGNGLLREEDGEGEDGMDTATLELVDQMEIEISEIEEGEAGVGGEKGVGVRGGATKERRSEAMETNQPASVREPPFQFLLYTFSKLPIHVYVYNYAIITLLFLFCSAREHTVALSHLNKLIFLPYHSHVNCLMIIFFSYHNSFMSAVLLR